MHPTTIPTTVSAMNVVMGRRSSSGQEVRAVAAEAARRVVHPHELAPLDPHYHVAGGRTLARGIPGCEQAVGVELVDVLQRGQHAGPCGLAPVGLARDLEGLDEEAGGCATVCGEHGGG